MTASRPIITCDICRKELGEEGFTSDRHAGRLKFLIVGDYHRSDWDICSDCLGRITDWAERRHMVERKRFLRKPDDVMEEIPL